MTAASATAALADKFGPALQRRMLAKLGEPVTLKAPGFLRACQAVVEENYTETSGDYQVSTVAFTVEDLTCDLPPGLTRHEMADQLKVHLHDRSGQILKVEDLRGEGAGVTQLVCAR